GLAFPSRGLHKTKTYLWNVDIASGGLPDAQSNALCFLILAALYIDDRQQCLQNGIAGHEAEAIANGADGLIKMARPGQYDRRNKVTQKGTGKQTEGHPGARDSRVITA